jgi:hypothetical protein
VIHPDLLVDQEAVVVAPGQALQPGCQPLAQPLSRPAEQHMQRHCLPVRLLQLVAVSQPGRPCSCVCLCQHDCLHQSSSRVRPVRALTFHAATAATRLQVLEELIGLLLQVVVVGPRTPRFSAMGQ